MTPKNSKITKRTSKEADHQKLKKPSKRRKTMYKLNIEIESENKIKVGEYIIKDKHLDSILGFCERTNYKVVGLKKI